MVGAVTVPLVLALGLSLANAVNAQEGFGTVLFPLLWIFFSSLHRLLILTLFIGILGMASVMPIVVIPIAGLIVRAPCCKSADRESAPPPPLPSTLPLSFPSSSSFCSSSIPHAPPSLSASDWVILDARVEEKINLVQEEK